MGLDPRITRSINRLNWVSPSPVQEAAIPYALEGKDVLAKAKTGSGKTASYAVPIVQKILAKKEVCIVPTQNSLLCTADTVFRRADRKACTQWYLYRLLN